MVPLLFCLHIYSLWDEWGEGYHGWSKNLRKDSWRKNSDVISVSECLHVSFDDGTVMNSRVLGRCPQVPRPSKLCSGHEGIPPGFPRSQARATSTTHTREAVERSPTALLIDRKETRREKKTTQWKSWKKRDGSHLLLFVKEPWRYFPSPRTRSGSLTSAWRY